MSRTPNPAGCSTLHRGQQRRRRASCHRGLLVFRRGLRRRRVWAAMMRRFTLCGATSQRWAATIRARAAAARNTKSAMEWRPDMETRNASSILQLGAVDLITDLPTALTFDDVLLVP